MNWNQNLLMLCKNYLNCTITTRKIVWDQLSKSDVYVSKCNNKSKGDIKRQHYLAKRGVITTCTKDNSTLINNINNFRN